MMLVFSLPNLSLGVCIIALSNGMNIFKSLRVNDYHAAYKIAEVESRTQGSRPRTQKKSEAKDSLSEDRTSRRQGQQCSRPRTKDTGASVLQKKQNKKIFKNFFR